MPLTYSESQWNFLQDGLYLIGLWSSSAANELVKLESAGHILPIAEVSHPFLLRVCTLAAFGAFWKCSLSDILLGF